MGRSGTHAMARLLGSHSRYRNIPREVRFHTDRGGLVALLEGRTSLRRFLRLMRTYWWRRPSAEGDARGLEGLVDPAVHKAALAAFEDAFPYDPLSAGRTLMSTLLDPLAEQAGKPAWVEQTPQTVAVAPALLRLFPDARFVHMVRDGRDIARSVTRRSWGPRTLRGGMSRWEERLRLADAGAAQAPPGALITIALEDLVAEDRERAYRELLEFLDLEDEPAMRKHHRKRMTGENAHLGRWRSELPESRQRRLSRAYERSLDRMAGDGVQVAGELRRRAQL